MDKQICEHSGIQISSRYRSIPEDEYQELLKLREEKKTWFNVCKYERDKWLDVIAYNPHIISDELREHWKNINSILENK